MTSPHGRISLSSLPYLATIADASSAPLLAALATYLVETRDVEEIRAAISRWCRDVEQANMQPEVLLVQFKALLGRLEASEQSSDVEQRIRDRREMISMCIEEFYRKSN